MVSNMCDKDFLLKYGSGVIFGFFLATLLFFGAIQYYAGIFYDDLVVLQPALETAYNITHSEKYANIADLISNPLITDTVPQVSSIVDVMSNAKLISEKSLDIVGVTMGALEISTPVMVVSVVMIVVSFVIAGRAKKESTVVHAPQQAMTKRKKTRRKKRR